MNKCLAYIQFLFVTLTTVLNRAITQEDYKEQELKTGDFVLLLWVWIKSLTNLDSVLKSRDITLLREVCIVKAMVFLVVMYKCESRTIKISEYWGIYAFKLWCWRRLLRVSWIARRSNQSILKEINHEYSLEGLMLKMKLQYFAHLM